jgi:Lon protease-like protein
LVKALRRHRKQCPSCREVCHISAENAAENIALKTLAVAFDPVGYQQRLDEYATEKASWTALYPVFFYNQAMLPGNKLSLHLFEPRYKLMMTRIVNTNRAFAYISAHYRAETSDVALIAELEEAEFLADGRCLLEATLKRRSRVVEHYVEDGTQGLHFVRLEPFADEEVPAAALEGLQLLKQRATALAEQLLSDAHTRRVVEQQFGSMPADAELFSMWFASISALSENEKTQALHSRSTVDRLTLSVQRTEAYLERRRNGRSFPIASAVGNTIATALTALLGGAPADAADAAASQGAGGDEGSSDGVPSLIGSSDDSDMQDDEGEEDGSDGSAEDIEMEDAEDGEGVGSGEVPQQPGMAWAATGQGAVGGQEAGEEEQQGYESTSSSLPGFSH